MKVITNLILDTIIFLSFFVAYEVKLTGEEIHEWVGLALFTILLVHLFLHWEWVVTVVKKFFRKIALTNRVNLIVDFLILVAFIAVTLSGIMISRYVVQTLGISLTQGGSWKQIHKLSAGASLYLLALHFALHWNWIVNAIKRYVLSPIGKRLARTPKMATSLVRIDEE